MEKVLNIAQDNNKNKNETIQNLWMVLYHGLREKPLLSRMVRYHDWKYVYYHGYDSQLFNLDLTLMK